MKYKNDIPGKGEFIIPHSNETYFVAINLEDIKLVSSNERLAYNPRVKAAYSTEKYKKFKNLLLSEAHINYIKFGKPIIEKPYSIKIEFSGYQDIDNPIKPICDALEDAGWIENDRYIENLVIIKRPLKRGQNGNIKVLIGVSK